MSSTDTVFGIGIGGYRCFDDMQYIGPLDRVNLFIGPNNVGKSSILHLFDTHLKVISNGVRLGNDLTSFTAEDDRSVGGSFTTPLRVCWPLDSAKLEATIPKLVETMWVPDLEAPAMRFATAQASARKLEFDPAWVAELDRLISPGEWNSWSMNLWSQAGGPQGEDRTRVLGRIRQDCLMSGPSEFISVPAHRQLLTGSAQDWDFAGAGFINQLDRIRNPEAGEHTFRRQHQDILRNVKEVLELSSFSYSVSRQSQTLVLEIDGEHFPLASLGTGFEHIILLIAATVIFPDAVLCVEEPEVHMHPRLQRRLATYLLDETSNQLMISTHSATLIDALQGRTFRLQRDGNQSLVSRPVEGQLLHALDDLGYRASDLLQTNCVIWVEGPSDRVYIQWWLNQVAPDLIDGVHYTIMFYGGAMLASTTAATDSDEMDLVPLRKLNQHFAIVCDSDRTSGQAKLKDRVNRILSETQDDPDVHVWVTGGRTIENYVDPDVLASAVLKVHPSTAGKVLPRGRFDDALRVTGPSGKPFQVNKVLVARDVVTSTPDLERLDLTTHLKALEKLIRAANA